MSETSRSSIPQPLAVALRRLRAQLTTRLVVHGISRLLCVLVIMLVVDFVLDRTFHMDQAQRLVMLCLALAGIGAVLFRKLFVPLRSRPTDEALCLEVESRSPQAGQSLISALQLSQDQLEDLQRRGYSAAMVTATLEAGARVAKETGFEHVLHHRRYHSNLLLAAGMSGILLAAVASTWASPTMAIWFQRNVMLGDRKWPHDVILHVAGDKEGRLVIPRDDDWPISITVDSRSRRQPREVIVDLRTPTGDRTLVTEQGPDGFTLILVNALDATHLRARAGQSMTEWLPIDWIDRPELQALRLSVTPPAYTGLGVQQLKAEEGPYGLLPGSRLKIQGVASKQLASGRISSPRGSIALQVSGKAFDVELADDQLQDAVYRLELTDTEQVYWPATGEWAPLTSQQPTRFTVRLRKDAKPQVRAELNGVSGLVVPQAIVPINVRVSDDFALVDVRLRHAVVGEQGAEEDPQTLELESLLDLPANAVRFEYGFDLRNRPVTVGATLQFHVEADDNNHVSGPGTGKSQTFLLRIVSEQDLRADMLRREKVLRQDFKQLVTQQEKLVTDTEALAGDSDEPLTWEPATLETLVQIQKRQKQLGTQIGNVARRFEEIAIEVANNRIEEGAGPLQTRLRDRIVEPAWLLADDTVPDLVNAMDEMRRIESGQERKQKLQNLVSDQWQLIADMQEILSQMEQSEGFQAAVNLLYEVQKAQQDVLELTDQERDALIKSILNKPQSSE